LREKPTDNKMDLIEEIRKIYNTRPPIEQICLDLIIEFFKNLNSNKLLIGENYSFVLNEGILTISLQHTDNNDRRILFLLQNDFIEIQLDCHIRIYYYENMVGDTIKTKEFKDFLLLILDRPYKHIEYYLNSNLVKYTTIWNDNSIKEKTIYIKPFGRFIEIFDRKRDYVKRESLAESFNN
jgi:hypothetical protein